MDDKARSVALQNAILDRFEMVLRNFMARERVQPGEQMAIVLTSTAHNLGHHSGTDENFESLLQQFVDAARQKRLEHKRECVHYGATH